MDNNPYEIIRYPGVQGVSITDRNIPESFHSHWHNAAEFICALKDGCKYKVRNNTYTLSKGDILLIWPRELHEIVHTPTGGMVFIQFSSDLLEQNLDLLSMAKFFAECHHIEASNAPALTSSIAAKIHEIGSLISSDMNFIETRCKMRVYDIILNISEADVENRFREAKKIRDRGDREDDKTLEIFHTRIEEFRKKTIPVLQHYKSLDLLVEINGDQSREAVHNEIIDKLYKIAQNNINNTTEAYSRPQ